MKSINFINLMLAYIKFKKMHAEFLTIFREDVKRCMAVDDTIIVISYNREVLGQTGAGICINFNFCLTNLTDDIISN